MAIEIKEETKELLGPEAVQKLEESGIAEAWHQRGKGGVTFYFSTGKRVAIMPPVTEPVAHDAVQVVVDAAIRNLDRSH